MSHTVNTTLPRDLPNNRQAPDRQSVETLIDQMGDQSFPASDPPAWGVIRARLGRTREDRKEG